MADQPATGASQAPLGTEGNPTHVVSRPAPTIGWAGVQSGVEEFDKEEIQGYKEDMDALLVFIGLFSAVLASFVAMSFSLLQASPAESMVFIMTGMSIQAASYTIQGEFMNSTAPAPTSLPSFEPTHNAIVVNILWTASLIVSLATASGALLVKQWLRQYTNQTTAFAMQKMRIRHFRRIALEDWGVIEIAYALPFLLLMSLPLFFVGLCYFTADIHSSVKNTTFSLVSAWAFFFIAATILPTFSARCPYKTPALSSLTSAMRVYLRPFWIKVLRILVATCADRDERSSFLRSILTTVRVWIATALANITYEGCLRLLGNVRLLRTRTSRILSTTGAHLREWLHHISAIRTMIHGWADRTLASMTNEEHLHDEATAIKTNAGDLAILVDADKLHGNDEVADAALSHAVRQSNLDWEEVLELAKSLILHRLPSQDMFSGTPEFVGLGDMTPRALAAVHNVLDYVESCQPLPWAELFPIPFLRSVCDHTEPECWAFFLRLSASFVQPPTTLPRWLDRCTEDDCDMLGTICQPSNSATVLRSLLALLCRRLEQPDFDLSTSVSRLQSFLWVYFERLDVPDSFEAEQPTPWSDILNNASLGPTVLWLTQQLKSDFATSTTGSSNVRSRETAWGHAVSLIVKFMVVLNDTSDFFDIRGVALKSSETLRSFWISCFKYQLHVSELLVPGHGIDAQGLSNIKTAIVALASDPPSEIDGTKALSLCRGLCESLWWDRSDVQASNLVPAWRGVFDALTQLVQRTQVEDFDAARDLVNWCFFWIIDVDGIDNSDDDAEYAAWLATFNPEDSPIPDEFISELLRINPNPHHPFIKNQSYLRLWCVRPLNELSDNAQSQPEGAAIPSAPDTPLPTSAVGGDDQGNTPQPSTSAAYDENLQADTNYPPHIDSHGPLTQNGTSNEVLRTVSGMTMSLTTNNATSGLVPDVTAAGSNNPLRHLGSHIHALHALSTAAQRLAEALLAELPAEHTDPSDNEPAAPVGIEESTICAGTTVPGEDVTGTRQVEAARGNTSNRDEQLSEERPVQAPDVTTRDSPSSPAGVVTQGSSSQDISSGDDEGGTHPVTFPGTSIAVHGAVNHQLEADMKNASTGLYSAPAVTLSSSSYAHPSHPDRPPETSHRESEGSSARRSSGGKDGKESTHDTGPPGSDGIEPTDT